MNLLTVNNPKTLKSNKGGYLTGILHLKPDYEVCPSASKGCMAGCLNTAGRGGINMTQQARARRTVMYKNQHDAFMFLLVEDITKLRNRAVKKGLTVCIRLNGTSDILWEYDDGCHGKNIFELFPDVQFYDYTPNERRMGNTPPNYHLTFSKKEDNDAAVQRVIEAGHNVAVVFRKALPPIYMGKRVINGDDSDLRFLDDSNVVVGLAAKGKAKKDMTGFVVDWEGAA